MPRGWPLAASGSSELTPNKMTQFRGMLSKYNYEYRRPFLEEAFLVLDAWKMEDNRSGKIDERLGFLRGDFFHVNIESVFYTVRTKYIPVIFVGTRSEDGFFSTRPKSRSMPAPRRSRRAAFS